MSQDTWQVLIMGILLAGLVSILWIVWTESRRAARRARK